ncbi:MAG TPA: dTDP-4-dehydrorhamnose 3,5-epimerase [Deltaproteobacteria bacterium]|nr:MAG: dTDP-4-dehydrorhamnose 3,5-epimerase [Deltaproteobacteria bacterium GWA2_55_82]OGQ63481.1 MAG: dTDP-4-dehydrorhamnose 3,5-epimerase [Deltaproteobacteria bacterium RIFCSPLOWO2_02_FULL_55_12]OIJ74862.1 MAG: dTDP-4-dehydrorhamnose 3,5-epimerase [Deltaproteobacteria bacterium GWC2_55_46]HBG47488.1 dTDP-4-dehydrorhamnose 3,5-epimerase [Deltaproteobacteria bacterium]HCY11504.1 dTDP-4-dehydrorhamnose 3,5-epimerase [Deltaproteobacteria bacterium]
MIEGLRTELLGQFADHRGRVMHMLRNDSPMFEGFGEIYFSIVNPGKVKAWKRHLRMTQHFAVPVGRIRLVVYDGREGSPTFGSIEVIETGEVDYMLIRIPPLLWYGFMGISSGPALIANCTDIPHSPEESERMDMDSAMIEYDWGSDDHE